jgi:Spy/CpxP family protein refolding chaperone
VRTLLAVMLLLVPVAVDAQQSAPDPARRAAMEARRDSLETELHNRFMDQLTRELALQGEQRARMERTLRANAGQRRELMHSSGELRGQLHRALRSAATTDAEFTRLLAAQDALRQRESDLWRAEQDELARFLTPRQRAQFVVQYARFQDSVRDILTQHMRAGPPRR